MRNLLLPFVAAVALLACGKAQVGEVCSDSDQCREGTQCIPYGATSSTTASPSCDATVRICSTPCSHDDDCDALGSGHICLSDCFQGSCVVGR